MLFGINRFHVCVLLTWQFAIFFASQQIFPIFAQYVPQWRCSEKEPFGKNCTAYEACGGRVQFEYEYFHSTAVEFDWVCGPRAYWAWFYSQLQFFGVLIGTVLFGSLSDRLGRKPVSTAALTGGLVASVLSGLAPSWELLLLSRFFIGLSIGGTLVVVCTFIMEMLLPPQRMALRAFFNWGTARLLVTLLCWWFPDWRSASLACALGASPALLLILLVLPESPTWLHTQNRLEDMRKSEQRIARVAGQPHVQLEIKPVVHNSSLCDLIKSGALLKRILVLWVMWFTAAISGYAVDLNSSNLHGHLFWNQVMFSILIAASKICLVVLDKTMRNFSRRLLHQGAQLVVCICFLMLTFLVLWNPKSIWILVVNLVGTMFIEYTWDACYLCAVETMPTGLRATSMGTCSLMARVGAILAPSLAYLNQLWAPSAYLTVVVLGLLNLTVSYFLLVETKDVVLDKVTLEAEQAAAEEQVEMLAKKDGAATD